MATHTLINNDYAELYFYEDTGIIHHRVTFETTGAHWQELLSMGTDILEKHKAIKWLSDNRTMNPHTAEDTDWINNIWLPKTIALGWRYWAVIVPDTLEARRSMVDFVEEFYDKGVRIMVFTELEPAMKWLEEVDK